MPMHLRGPRIPEAAVTSAPLPAPPLPGCGIPRYLNFPFLKGGPGQSFLDLSGRYASSQGCVRRECRK